MTVRVTGLRVALTTLENDIEGFVNTELETRTLAAFSDVVVATPVDTGNARNSWRVNPTFEQEGPYELVGQQVENTTNYIQTLNDGSSAQAASMFIENSFLRYFDEVNVEVIPGELE